MTMPLGRDEGLYSTQGQRPDLSSMRQENAGTCQQSGKMRRDRKSFQRQRADTGRWQSTLADSRIKDKSHWKGPQNDSWQPKGLVTASLNLFQKKPISAVMCGLYILLGPWPSRSSVNTVHQRPCRQIRGGSRADRLEVNLHMEPGRSFLWRCYRHLPAVGCYHRERLVLTGRMSVWYQYLVLTPLFCNGVCQGSDQSKWRTISLFQTF